MYPTGNENITVLLVLAILIGIVLLMIPTLIQSSGETICTSRYPEWDKSLCVAISEKRFSERDVLTHPEWDWLTIASQRIRVDMTSDMVRAAWGDPKYVNEHEFLEYDEEWSCGGHLLQFSGAVLRKITDARTWSATNVVRIYDENEISADEQLEGVHAFVTGYIDEISESWDGQPYIELHAADSFDDVRCYFSNAYRSELAQLKRRQFIVVLGVGAGTDFGEPIFTNCRIFES